MGFGMYKAGTRYLVGEGRRVQVYTDMWGQMFILGKGRKRVKVVNWRNGQIALKSRLPRRWRTFGGKLYKFYGYAFTKQEAEAKKRELIKDRYVRVIRSEYFKCWLIYAITGKKEPPKKKKEFKMRPYRAKMDPYGISKIWY